MSLNPTKLRQQAERMVALADVFTQQANAFMSMVDSIDVAKPKKKAFSKTAQTVVAKSRLSLTKKINKNHDTLSTGRIA